MKNEINEIEENTTNENVETTQTEEASNKPTQGKLRETLKNIQNELKAEKENASQKDRKIQELTSQLEQQKNIDPQTYTNEIDRIIAERIKPIEAKLNSVQARENEEKLHTAINTLKTQGATEDMISKALNENKALINDPAKLIGDVLMNKDNAEKIAAIQKAQLNTDSVSINTEQKVDQKVGSETDIAEYAAEVDDMLKDF